MSMVEGFVVLTDEEIAAAFQNTNFGSTDFKNILLTGVKKTALRQHNGYTLTSIIRNLGLGVKSHDDEASNVITENGLMFIMQMATEKSAQEISRVSKKLEQSEGYIKRMDAVIDGKGITRSCINPLVDLTNAVDYAVGKIEAQRTEIEMLKSKSSANDQEKTISHPTWSPSRLKSKLAELEPYDSSALSTSVDEDQWLEPRYASIPTGQEVKLRLSSDSAANPWSMSVLGTKNEHGVWEFNTEVPNNFIINQWQIAGETKPSAPSI